MELIKINPEQFGLSEIQATAIANKFLPILEEMQPHLDKYEEIKDLDPADPANSKQFRELRLKLVKCRTNATKIHKDEKAYYLAGGKYVDSYKNEQLKITEPIEADLAEKEKYAEIQEIKRKELLRSERAEKLRKWECEEANNPALGEIADSTFEIIIAGAELAYKNKIEAEKQAEIDRLKAEELTEKLRQEENIWALYYQRIADQEENERKNKEREEQAEKSRIAELEKAKKQAEFESSEKVRIANESAAEAERKQKFAEAEAQRKIKEATAEAEADRKTEIERLAKEKRIAEEKAAKAPDIEKFAVYIKLLRDQPIPDIKEPEMKALLQRFFVAMKTAISIIDIEK